MGREGARVAVVDIRIEAAQESADLLRKDGVEAEALECDVAIPEQVAATVDSVVDRFKRVDILHNNAGVVIAGSVHSLPLEDWDRVFAVNVRGIFLVSKAVLPIMQSQRSGVIVNTASISGLVGEPHLAAYNASKGAIVNLTRQIAVDYGADGVRCNCVCPGWIDTGFNQPIFDAGNMSDDEVRRLVEDTVPMRRQGNADEVASAVAFLASDDASYITGHPLVIDGGQLAL
jgi:NAD(P)-dependent dehydrogenase (short-subunit alcohol dehydrogenase family)